MSLLRFAGVCGLALAVLSIATAPEQAQARPQYRKAFGLKYPDLKEVENEKKCGVCHPKADDKKKNNTYGVALKKQLDGKKNEKDEKVLSEALGKIEAEKSATEGKTFGDLIKEGKLPGADEVAEEEKK